MCNNSIGYPVGSIHEREGENGIISKRENALRHISPRARDFRRGELWRRDMLYDEISIVIRSTRKI